MGIPTIINTKNNQIYKFKFCQSLLYKVISKLKKINIKSAVIKNDLLTKGLEFNTYEIRFFTFSTKLN